MKDELINLTAEDIYGKEFKVEIKGYCTQEVDQYLDLIIADYQEYNKKIKNLEEIIEKQSEDILALKQENRDLKTNVEISKSYDNFNGVDILKRVSELEKIVYGRKDN